MCDKELLVGYLYDEVDALERRSCERHLLSCAECREELQGLRGARTRIAAWAPPEPDLAFRVVREGAVQPRSRHFSVSPAWGLAAAAALVLSVASAVANVEVRYGAEGLVIRTGAARAAALGPAPGAITPSAIAPSPVTDREETLSRSVQALAMRVHDLEAVAPRVESPAVRQAVTQGSPAEMLRQVHRIVSESEERQQQELALRIMQVMRDVDGSRRQDAEAVQRSLARVQGQTDTTLIRQRAIENHLYRVGMQQK